MTSIPKPITSPSIKVVFEVIEIIKKIEASINVDHKYLSCSEFFIFNSGKIYIKLTILTIFKHTIQLSTTTLL